MTTPPASTSAENGAAGSAPPTPAAPQPPPDFSDLKKLLSAPPISAEESEPTRPVSTPAIDHSHDLAESFTRLLTIVCGFIFGAPEEAKPDAEERAHLNKASAAYFRTKAWQFAAGAAFGLAWVSYLLRVIERPKSGERVRSWFGFADAKNVTPAGGPSPGAAARAPGAAAAIITLPPTTKLG